MKVAFDHNRAKCKLDPQFKADLEESMAEPTAGLYEMFGRLKTVGIPWTKLNDPNQESLERANAVLKRIDETCDFTDDISTGYIQEHEELKKFFEIHTDVGTYHNAFWKCDNDDCVCGSINSPPEVFREVKEEGTK